MLQDQIISNDYDVEEMDDVQLVQLSQSGNREAFGELVRRHRAEVFGYAQSITQERYLAEDIVQDALIRAFMHLGKLVEPSRFLPWLHRIVRNQAYTKLQSRTRTAERTFSSLLKTKGDPEEGRFHDLDYILHRLTRSMSNEADVNNLPEERIVRQEILGTIIGMLRCLNGRERQVFESHFFDHLSPQEIAKLFQLSSSNVYQIISRSRKKVMQEKIRIVVDHYMKSRRDMNLLSKVILTKHDSTAPTWTTAAGAMHTILQYTDKKPSLPMVIGLSGFAFRITLLGDDINIAGPTVINYEAVMKNGLHNMGIEAIAVEGMKEEIAPNANFVSPSLMSPAAAEKRSLHKALPEALDLLHRSINRGYPVLAWDIFVPEFGVIYGYDDELQMLHAVDVAKDGTVHYNHLGRSLTEDLFVLAIDQNNPIDPVTSLRGALDMILRHYRGDEDIVITGSVHGIAAYDHWISAFLNGQIEPNGSAYNLAVVYDARLYAAAFFKELSTAWDSNSEITDHVRTLCLEAAVIYEQMAQHLAVLTKRYPFPVGGDPNDSSMIEENVKVLQAVKALEQKAVTILQKMNNFL